MKKLSIVVPCFNESGNIPLIINRFKEVISDRQNVEVILVNNGSSDNSQLVFSSELEKCSSHFFRVHHVPVNLGYGHGILEGLKIASGDILSWTHADMQTDPNDVLKGFDFFCTKNSSTSILKGKRKNRRLLEAFFTLGMQIVVYFKLNIYLDDINAQPKMFSREFYEKYILNQSPLDFSLDLFLLYCAKKNNYSILEIPVYFAKRIHGEAKGGSTWKVRIKLIKRTLKFIDELKASTLKLN